MTTRWKDVWAARTLDAGKASMLGSSLPTGIGGILADHDQREGVVLATSRPPRLRDISAPGFKLRIDGPLHR